jgi:hypothetical protein
MKLRIGCLMLVFLSLVLPMAAQQTAAVVPAVVTYYGCVNNSTGAIRIVSKTTVCKPTEHKISWNQSGPQGPQGPQGAQGPQGPPGISVGNFAGNTLRVPLGAIAVVVATNPMQVTGTYYINATALVYVGPSDSFAECFVTIGSNGNPDGLYGESSSPGHEQSVSIADSWFVGAGDFVALLCDSNHNDANTFVANSSLTAILINSAFDAKKAQHPRHVLSNHPKAPK